jgi:hypothetical protein
VLPLQQPLGHEVASQTQWPLLLLHSWPLAHAVQEAPPAPHAALLSDEYARHVAPLQHPVEHDPPPQVQDPLVQASPVLQAPQAAPPVPHCEVDCEA